MTDIEIIREAIESFAKHYFDTINMAEAVRCQKKDDINYFSIDLENVKWDGDLGKFHQSLMSYLKEFGKQNFSNFKDYVAISRLTIEYLLPEIDGTNQNQARHIKLFYLPAYYYRSRQNSKKKAYPSYVIRALDIWNNIIVRNTVLTLLPTIFFVIWASNKVATDSSFLDRLIKAYDYINIASGIIASFVLGFLVTKVIAIRQDKQKYTGAILQLSNQLTYFRNICRNLAGDHQLWSEKNPFHKSYQYANSIKQDITFEEYYYPNFDDDIRYAKYKSFYKEDMSHNVISLILQMHMMADESLLDKGLTYTKFPPNYVYSVEEMEKFALFCDSNRIWYCCTETTIFPNEFYLSYATKQTIEEINRIYPENKIADLSKDKLEEVSLDFQYHIIPRLYNLTRVVNAGLPAAVGYFVVTFILLLSFGVIMPTLTYIFFDKGYSFLYVFASLAIIAHILLTLKPILKSEITLDTKYDYL